MEFERISVAEAKTIIDDAKGAVQIVDIRDEQSYAGGHIEGAFHLHNDNIQAFIQAADPEQPIIVCCYHGNMSQSAAAFFAEQGFHQSFSLDGGYEAWSESMSEPS